MKYYHIDRGGANINSLFIFPRHGYLTPHYVNFTLNESLLASDSKNLETHREDFLKESYYNQISNEEYNEIAGNFDEQIYNISDKLLYNLIEKSATITEDNKIYKFILEIILERYRIEKYPNKPSRFCCTFLTETENMLAIWKQSGKFQIDKDDKNIIHEFIEGDRTAFPSPISDLQTVTHSADANWLHKMDVNNLEECYQLAERYWSSEVSKEPLWEILFYGILKKMVV